MQEPTGLGLHRVVSPRGVLPQAAWQLDPSPTVAADEVRVRVERLNIDAASFRQLRDAHDGNGAAVRRDVAEIVRQRGKLHNPVTGSGGMLVGAVEEVGGQSPLELSVGDRVATLVSLTLTPLALYDNLANWDGESEQVPTDGHAILFARSAVAKLPEDVPTPVALAVLDVCGAPALTARVVSRYDSPRVLVLGAAGKSGALSLAAARTAAAGEVVAVVRDEAEQQLLQPTTLADTVVVADARDPIDVASVVEEPADVTVVCVDVPGCEHAALLGTRDGGTVIFFSLATSFTAAALGAEGLAADVTMLIGNGYVPGHADFALDLVRSDAALLRMFRNRVGVEVAV